jgi:NADPH:quinone reductase-like Zn-dependent oxidoreductase
MNGLTARQTLDLLGLRPGQSLAVTGAAGAYGGVLIELAKVAGLHVIADAAPADEALVRKLGADIVVPRGETVATHIREHAPGGVDALADGALQGTILMPAIRDGGAYAALRPANIGGGAEPERDITIHSVMVADYVAGAGGKLDELRQLVNAGRVSLRVAQTLPVGRAAYAHRLLEAGGVRGRLILEF